MNIKRFLAVFAVLAGLASGFKFFSDPLRKNDPLPENPIQEENFAPARSENPVVIEKPRSQPEKIVPEAEIPERILINIPFTTQAPFANWDAKHEEACEEASLLMLAYHLEGKRLTKEIAEAEIQKMIDFEIKHYGDYKDSSADQLIGLAADFFGIKNLQAVYDFKKDDLKKELAKGRPIIVLAAGRELGNPNFKSPGPLYHALVLKGYEGNSVITNDPGTRKGEGYRYDLDILYAAIHEYDGDLERIGQGRKAMIVIRQDN